MQRGHTAPYMNYAIKTFKGCLPESVPLVGLIGGDHFTRDLV